VVVLAVKLLLAPAFVVGASLTARRYGPRVGGLVGALPVVAGPILLVYALEHGRVFAAHAAAGTLLGLISLTAFVVAYAHLAGRVPWPVALLAGWLAFVLGTLLFSSLAVGLGWALLLACAGFALGLLLLPHAGEQLAPGASPPIWDLPLRAGCALALVLALTAVAGWLGPQLSGLLAPFPIIASVLATFTHTQRGVDEARRLLRGLLRGFWAFALFCFTLALALEAMSVGIAFALATAAALLAQGVVLRQTLRKPAAAPPVNGAQSPSSEALRVTR
jgi:hypothetical protein